ncbi:glutaredoxin family protein [Demequina muriae]|uniref:Glutaredoxin family protein n=1 Tax=Demequina muriae TaxID=3051664 RepID=A0ABT8GHJ7_9MICO|nr:glutaredoxin family protein [Demequina sp. EGI L300058]MDN4480741.1 glutaredoxin family protein [Demequina sp. EGI L300058]
MAARVSLITRQGCHLCPDARSVVREVCDEAGVDWREVDVEADSRLLERFADEVPVVIVDGQVVGFWHIDAARLRSALA